MFQKKISKEYVENYAKHRYNVIEPDKLYFKKIIKKTNLKLKNKTILDLAAGPGNFEIVFDEYKPKKVTLLDSTNYYLDVAKKYHKKLIKSKIEFKYVLDDLMGIKKFKNNSQDFIICFIALFYVKDEYSFFKHISRVLKKNGMFYFRTPTEKSLKYYDIKERIICKVFNKVNLITKRKLFPIPMQDLKLLKKAIKNANLKIVFEEYNERGYIDIVVKKLQ